MTFFGVVMEFVPFRALLDAQSRYEIAPVQLRCAGRRHKQSTSNSDGVDPGFPRPDPDCFFDI